MAASSPVGSSSARCAAATGFRPIFGDRYAEELKRVPRLSTYLHANVTRLGLAPGGAKIDEHRSWRR